MVVVVVLIFYLLWRDAVALDYSRRQVRQGVWKINQQLYSLQKVRATIQKVWLFRNVCQKKYWFVPPNNRKNQSGKEPEVRNNKKDYLFT